MFYPSPNHIVKKPPDPASTQVKVAEEKVSCALLLCIQENVSMLKRPV